MSGLNPRQLLSFVIRPALGRLVGSIPCTMAAEQLVLGTGMVESGLNYLDQRVGSQEQPGPAYGLWQMEKVSFEDHLERLSPKLEQGVFGYLSRRPYVEDLHWNLLLGAAMCRILYWHAPERLPAAGDYHSMAAFWKLRYNTPLGAGTVDKAIPYFKEACLL